jgi:DNA helicase-2/ATP-dependent DNA helicase PcrA
LFYVAVTRAKDELYLCHPLLRFAQGAESMQQRSRFLQELPQELMEEWKVHVAWSGFGTNAGRAHGGTKPDEFAYDDGASPDDPF